MEEKYMEETVRNKREKVRNLLLIVAAVFIQVLLFAISEVWILFVWGNMLLLSAASVFVFGIAFVPLGTLLVARGSDRFAALLYVCILGIVYTITGNPELLIVTLVTVLVCSVSEIHPELKKKLTLGKRLVQDGIVTAAIVIGFFCKDWGNHYIMPIPGIIIGFFALVVVSDWICVRISKALLSLDYVGKEEYLDHNFRKMSINRRLLTLINVVCIVLLLIFGSFFAYILSSQLEQQNIQNERFMQAYLSDVLAKDALLLEQGTDAELESCEKVIQTALERMVCQVPMNVYVAMVDSAGQITCKGYYLVLANADTAEDALYQVTWCPAISQEKSFFAYSYLTGSDHVGIQVASKPEINEDLYQLFRMIVCAIIVTFVAIQLVAQHVVRKYLAKPINELTTVALDFAFDEHDDIAKFKDSLQALDIQTGDEIESLYTALSQTMAAMTDYIREVKEFSEKVSAIQHNVIVTMADIIESRDKSTGGHVKRTAVYVKLIAEKLREEGKYTDILTEQYVENMIVAAPLHDMGKIQVPDSILNKNGRLDDAEFAIMKGHASAGRDLLSHASEQLGAFEYLDIALQMASSHHEWWNGKGYPDGLSGYDIPLCARIMAVADVFDALVSKRCYKDGMPLEKAYQIIREESGDHFDPVVAEAFLACLDEVEKIMEQI